MIRFYVQNIHTYNSDVRPRCRDDHTGMKVTADRHCIWLRDRILTDRFQHQRLRLLCLVLIVE